MLEFLVAVTPDQTKQILEVNFFLHLKLTKSVEKWLMLLTTETLKKHYFQVLFDL